MSNITTEVLDINLGKAAHSVPLALEFHIGKGAWKEVATGVTDTHGKASLHGQANRLEVGRYRLTFNTHSYFASVETKAAFPYVTVVFEVSESGRSVHVPLHLSRHGYSTSCT